MSDAAREWFLQARLISDPEERSAFLARVCADDGELLEQVRGLLADEAQAKSLFGESGSLLQGETITLETEGGGSGNCGQSESRRIGRYQLLQRVGEGGFGIVWMAEQTEPVRRRVALKVIKLGMDTKAVVARFEAERQALALMSHPNIARVLDAGATAQGRPYFVMELVRGIPITDYCDQEKISTKGRLDLFIKVCQAVQHAHQKGIIHRDLKPSNILVMLRDGIAVPKVIDFGIAKATVGRLTDSTVFTQLHQFLGTPAYMSPEQAEMSGLDIDTRSDIYSLGVLLYELLTGTTPFDAQKLVSQGIDTMRRTIREEEPMRPSARLMTFGGEELALTSRRRSADPGKLRHLLQGDLDWIVMKCLEKDRARRYETANGLAMDVQRHLNHELVVARPPSAAYRLHKAWRRHSVAYTAGAAVTAALVFGIAVSAWQAVRATRAEAEALAEKAQAQKEKANVQAALHFIQEDVLGQASPGFEPDRDLKVRTLLDRISDRLDGATGRPPLVEASIRQTLGSIYTELGDFPKAVGHYSAALRMQREELGENDPDTLRSLHGLAMAHWWSGEIATARPLTEAGFQTGRRVLGENHPLTLQLTQARAFTELYVGELSRSETEALFLDALTRHREVLGPNHPATLRLAYGAGLGYYVYHQETKAAALVEEALDRAQRSLGPNHPETVNLTSMLAAIWVNLSRFEKAEQLARASWELRRRLLGAEHPSTVNSEVLLARTFVRSHRYEEAERTTARCLQTCCRLAVENSPFLAVSLSQLGWDYLQEGNLALADALTETALQAMRRRPHANPLSHRDIPVRAGATKLACKRYAEAETLLREGLTSAGRAWHESGFYFPAISLLGASLLGQENFPEAEALLLEAYRGLRENEQVLSPYLNPGRRIRETTECLVQLYRVWNKPARAAEWQAMLAGLELTAKASALSEPQL